MVLRVMIFSLLGALGLGWGTNLYSVLSSTNRNPSFFRIGFAYVLFSEQGPTFDIITALRTTSRFVWSKKIPLTIDPVPVGGVIIFGTHMVCIGLGWSNLNLTSSSTGSLQRMAVLAPPSTERSQRKRQPQVCINNQCAHAPIGGWIREWTVGM